MLSWSRRECEALALAMVMGGSVRPVAITKEYELVSRNVGASRAGGGGGGEGGGNTAIVRAAADGRFVVDDGQEENVLVRASMKMTLF